MKTGLFITIVLLSGCFAGIIYGALNLVIVEPYLEDAISIENQNLFESGAAEDTPQFWVEYYKYRSWQQGGEVLAGAILGNLELSSSQTEAADIDGNELLNILDIIAIVNLILTG